MLILTFEQTFPPPFAKPVLEVGNGARVRTPEHDHDENKLMTLVKKHGKKEKLILIDLNLDLFSFYKLCTLWKTKYNVQPRYLHTDRANCVAGPGVEGQSIKDTDFK